MTVASGGLGGASALRAAAVQMCSTGDVAENLEAAAQLIESAAAAGASLITLPENFAILGAREIDKVAVMETDGSATIRITRTPGSFESVAVFYTEDNTATAGVDYTATQGTFSVGNR